MDDDDYHDNDDDDDSNSCYVNMFAQKLFIYKASEIFATLKSSIRKKSHSKVLLKSLKD